MRGVVIDTQSELTRLLLQRLLQLSPQRMVPLTADFEIENYRNRDNNEEKCAKQLEEDAALHFGASNLYPTPRTVRRKRGFSASCSIFSRMRRTYTSTDRSVT